MKRGFTLIEVIVVMAIMLILFSASLSINKSFKSIVNNLQAKSSLNEISNLISYGKYYCRYNERLGSIVVNKELGEICFNDDSGKRKMVKKIKLPNNFKFISNLSFDIKNNGHIITSDKIRLVGSDGKLYKVTIATGVDRVSIYD